MPRCLRAERVRAEAARSIVIDSGIQEGVAKRFLPLLFGSEPVVEELPGCFVPAGLLTEIDEGALLQVAVGGKLLYALTRWMDDVADSNEDLHSLESVHVVSRAVQEEAMARFSDGLACDRKTAAFFRTMTVLNARYAASLAVDGAFSRGADVPMELEGYLEHASARAAPIRAPVEAVLLLVDASPDLVRKARACFDLWAAALQLVDDALDVEEDFRDRRLSWVVAKTLGVARRGSERPYADDFYEAALLHGHIGRGLRMAEDLYGRCLKLADRDFPHALGHLRDGDRRVRELRQDMASLVSASAVADPAP